MNIQYPVCIRLSEKQLWIGSSNIMFRSETLRAQSKVSELLDSDSEGLRVARNKIVGNKLKEQDFRLPGTYLIVSGLVLSHN